MREKFFKEYSIIKLMYAYFENTNTKIINLFQNGVLVLAVKSGIWGMLYTSGLINRQTFVVGGKKKTHRPFFCRGAGRVQPLLFSEFPPTLACQNIKCSLYNMC
ncbi:hypothetical protein HMPREF0083_04518 [Aneurinibacillus aneurinilyticus ATCC 12856]|uniref:Uncharacterized protein n=1 Tax=Aneurinibacillus aneurinilyticus ATCC 12856 TaxID=649747 RepID=U1Y5G7_ANEAE|nr:hypothetical protein HMPREF0083_04518 [Aneurinibacillus aneurinilyticus ATCC 12856]